MDTRTDPDRRPTTPDLRDAEQAFDQAVDLYKTALASGDSDLIRDADEALGRAGSRLDEVSGAKCCTACREPITPALAALGIETHSRCESLEAQDSMTDEEMEAVLAERPLHESDAQEAA